MQIDEELFSLIIEKKLYLFIAEFSKDENFIHIIESEEIFNELLIEHTD